ncbi:MAG: hypothetical protein NT013_02420 [Planctomycetia bacterium]|nr:hypothetical protein [Planctomycetia bacterium]
MTEPHDTQRSSAASSSPSANDLAGLRQVNSAAEADAPTCAQKTLSETGNEGSEVLAKSGNYRRRFENRPVPVGA